MIKTMGKTKCILIIIVDILKENILFDIKNITGTKMEFIFLRFALSPLVAGAVYKTCLADLTITFYKIPNYLKIGFKIGLFFYYEMVQPPWGITFVLILTILLLSSLQYKYNQMIC